MMRGIFLLLFLCSPLSAQGFAWVQSTEESLQAQVADLKAQNESLRAQLRALPAKEPTPAAKIVMECMSNEQEESICQACDNWWNGKEPSDLVDNGWYVKKVPVIGQRGKFYPRWRVCIGDECGFIENTSDFKGALRNYLAERELRKGLKK